MLPSTQGRTRPYSATNPSNYATSTSPHSVSRHADLTFSCAAWNEPNSNVSAESKLLEMDKHWFLPQSVSTRITTDSSSNMKKFYFKSMTNYAPTLSTPKSIVSGLWTKWPHALNHRIEQCGTQYRDARQHHTHTRTRLTLPHHHTIALSTLPHIPTSQYHLTPLETHPHHLPHLTTLTQLETTTQRSPLSLRHSLCNLKVVHLYDIPSLGMDHDLNSQITKR
jgi:hypothetical protein